MLWLSRINRLDLLYKKTSIKVCSFHFRRGKPAPPSGESDPDWAPCLRLGNYEAEEEFPHCEPPLVKLEVDCLDSEDDQPSEANQEEPAGCYPTNQSTGVLHGGAQENNSYGASSLNLGNDFPPALQQDASLSVELQHRGITETAGVTENSECFNISSWGQAVMVKEEVSSDQEDFTSDDRQFTLDATLINRNCKREPPASNFSLVPTIDSQERKAEGLQFAKKEAELCELQQKHTHLLNQHTSLQKDLADLQKEHANVQKEHADLQRGHANLQMELTDLQKEHAELIKNYKKLRDKLTDAEVDKLELNNELAELKNNSAIITKENALLQAASASDAGKIHSYENQIHQLQNSLQQSIKKEANLRKELDKALQCCTYSDILKKDDVLVDSLTGLPSYSKLVYILSLVTPEMTDTSSSLGPLECLLLTMMRIKLSVKLQVLGERFTVSRATVSRVFERWLHYLFKLLKVFIQWPEKDSLPLLNSTPYLLRKVFDDSSIFIIDCMELFAGKLGQNDYNSNQSVKLLIAYTPDGNVAFLSKQFDGKCSDMFVTVNSGLLEKLSPGDVILAKRGFSLEEKDGFYCARVVEEDPTLDTIHFEPFSINDKDDSSFIQRYVQAVTNAIASKFSLLQRVLPRELFTKRKDHDASQVEQVVSVCCAFMNLSGS